MIIIPVFQLNIKLYCSQRNVYMQKSVLLIRIMCTELLRDSSILQLDYGSQNSIFKVNYFLHRVSAYLLHLI